MIHDVEKFVFVGVNDEVDRFFSKAQELGFIQFIPPSGKKLIEMPASLKDLSTAITILRKQPVPKSKIFEMEEDGKKIATEIVGMKKRLEKLYEEQRVLRSEIVRISPFGDFSPQEIRDIEEKTSRHVQFFAMKEAISHKIDVPEELVYLTTEYDMDYFMSISPYYMSVTGMIEMHFDRSLSDLKKQLSENFIEIRKLEEELKESARFLPVLRSRLVDEINGYALDFAKSEITPHLGESLFAVEGFIPSNKKSKLESLLNGLAIHAEKVEIEPNDRVPTYMENAGVNQLGEDLVRIYDVPDTEDKDPSGWVFWAFLAFFSMIVADAGYGFLFLSLSYFFLWKFKQVQGAGRRVMRLFNFLSWGCLIWGIVIGSYFGMDLSPENPLKKITLIHFLNVKKAAYHMNQKDDVYQRWIEAYPSLKEATTPTEFLLEGKTIKEGKLTYQIINEFSDNILMEIALLIGVIHISLSLLRYGKKSWSGVGWCLFIIGGYLYCPTLLNATSLFNFLGIISKSVAAKVGTQMAIGGIGIALLLAIVQKKWKGLTEIAHLIQIFADILSYLRIYALGLAAMILAATFNELGKKVGLFGGFVIILAGHLTNITLAIMGGVIHGLRLNFIEWYHYSFTGDGKLFSPLKLRR